MTVPTIHRLGRAVAALGLSLLAASCQGINPPAPSPEPEAPLPAVQASFMTVPIRLSSAALEAEADARLSAEEGPAGMYWTTGERVSDSARIQFGVHRSGPTRIAADGDRLVLAVPIAINRGRVDWETRGLSKRVRQLPFGGKGVVTLRIGLAVGPDWHLRASVEPGFRWTERAWVDVKLPVGHVKIDVASRVEPGFARSLASLAARIEAAAAAGDTRGRIERAWAALQRPIALAGQPPAALEIEPLSIALGPLTSEGGDLVARPVLVAKLRAHLGAPGPAPPPRPLPANAGGPGGDGLSLSLRIDAPYAELNALVRDKVVDRTYTVKDGRAITVRGIRLSALGSKLLVRLDFEAEIRPSLFGTAAGWVYFSGVPRYDDGTRQLRVEEFGYEVGTRNALLRAGDWLLHDRFVQDVGQALVFDLSAKVDPMRRRVLAGIRELTLADGVVLDATVNAVELSDLHVGKDAISLFATVRGAATLSVSR